MRFPSRLPMALALAAHLPLAACGGDEGSDLGSTGEVPGEAADPGDGAIQGGGDLGQEPFVTIAQHPAYGDYLVNRQDQALYAFAADSAGEPTCTGECARVWPAFVVDEGDPIAEEPLDDDLIGTVVRSDGARQVTFGGWPLYYYSEDGARSVTGQGRMDHGGEWWLMRPDGSVVRGPPGG